MTTLSPEKPDKHLRTSSLVAQVSSLNQIISRQQSEINQQQDLVKELKLNLKKAKIELQDNIIALDEQQNQHTSKIEALQSDFQSQFADVSEKYKLLKSKFIQLQQEYQNQQTRLEIQAQNKKQEIKQLKQYNQGLTQKVQDGQTEIEKQQVQFAQQLRSDKQRYIEQEAQLKLQIAHLESQIQNSEYQVKDLRQQLITQANQQQGSQRKAIEQLKAQHDSEISQLNEQHRNMVQQYQQQQIQLKAGCDQTIAQLQQQLDSKVEIIQQLQNSINDERRQTKDQMQLFKQQIVDLSEQVEILQAKTIQPKIEHFSLTGQLQDDIHTLQLENDKLSVLNQRFQAEILLKDQEIENAKASVNQQLTTQFNLANGKLQLDVDTLKGQYEKTQKALTRVREEMAEKEVQWQRQKAALQFGYNEALQKQQAQYQKELATACEEKQELVAKLRQQTDKLQVQLAEREKEVQENSEIAKQALVRLKEQAGSEQAELRKQSQHSLAALEQQKDLIIAQKTQENNSLLATLNAQADEIAALHQSTQQQFAQHQAQQGALLQNCKQEQEALRQAYEDQIGALRAKIGGLTESRDGEVTELKRRLLETQQTQQLELLSARKENESLSAQLIDLQQQARQREAEGQLEVQRLTQSNQELVQRLQDAEQQQRDAQSELLASRQEDRDQMNQTLSQINMQQRAQFQARMDQSRQQIDELHAQMRAIQQHCHEVAVSDDQRLLQERLQHQRAVAQLEHQIERQKAAYDRTVESQQQSIQGLQERLEQVAQSARGNVYSVQPAGAEIAGGQLANQTPTIIQPNAQNATPESALLLQIHQLQGDIAFLEQEKRSTEKQQSETISRLTQQNQLFSESAARSADQHEEQVEELKQQAFRQQIMHEQEMRSLEALQQQLEQQNEAYRRQIDQYYYSTQNSGLVTGTNAASDATISSATAEQLLRECQNAHEAEIQVSSQRIQQLEERIANMRQQEESAVQQARAEKKQLLTKLDAQVRESQQLHLKIAASNLKYGDLQKQYVDCQKEGRNALLKLELAKKKEIESVIERCQQQQLQLSSTASNAQKLQIDELNQEILKQMQQSKLQKARYERQIKQLSEKVNEIASIQRESITDDSIQKLQELRLKVQKKDQAIMQYRVSLKQITSELRCLKYELTAAKQQPQLELPSQQIIKSTIQCYILATTGSNLEKQLARGQLTQLASALSHRANEQQQKLIVNGEKQKIALLRQAIDQQASALEQLETNVKVLNLQMQQQMQRTQKNDFIFNIQCKQIKKQLVVVSSSASDPPDLQSNWLQRTSLLENSVNSLTIQLQKKRADQLTSQQSQCTFCMRVASLIRQKSSNESINTQMQHEVLNNDQQAIVNRIVNMQGEKTEKLQEELSKLKNDYQNFQHTAAKKEQMMMEANSLLKMEVSRLFEFLLQYQDYFRQAQAADNQDINIVALPQIQAELANQYQSLRDSCASILQQALVLYQGKELHTDNCQLFEQFIQAFNKCQEKTLELQELCVDSDLTQFDSLSEFYKRQLEALFDWLQEQQ